MFIGSLGLGSGFLMFSPLCDFRIFQDCWYLSCISRFGHQYGPRNLCFVRCLHGQPRTTHWLKMDIRSVRRHGVESMLSPNSVEFIPGVFYSAIYDIKKKTLCILLIMPNLHFTMRDRWRNHQKACKLPLRRKMPLSIPIRVC
jgi:hypothetical protein